MHKLAVRPRSRRADRSRPGSHLSATHAVRAASQSDAADIHALVGRFAAEGLLLPRAIGEIETAISSFVVVVDRHDRVLACAALDEYSPSVAEVAAVAVAPEAQGRGLGSLAVRAVEAMARRRGIPDLFALSRATHFFTALGYAEAPLAEFPEKVARYDALRARGIHVAPKRCFRKPLD